MRPALRRSRLSAAAGVVVVLALGLARPAGAAEPTLTISLDREAAAPGEPFQCEVQLSLSNGADAEDFRPPELRGLRVLSGPQAGQSTQMQIGGGQTIVQNVYTWTYELMIPPGAKGPFTIGGARVRVGGRDLKSNTITVRVGSGPPASNPRRGGMPPGFPFDMFGQPQAPPAEASGGETFVRVVADKTRVFVGEPVVVTWSLCSPQARLNYNSTTEPRTDGFWTEDVPSTTPRGQATQETIAGRAYNVSTIMHKALFPLREGKLAVTPLELEVAQVDFFGMAVRSQKLKSEGLAIEAMPLPREGQPPGFDPSNVGQYSLAAHADRTAVAVGEAVTVSIEIKGVGNVRNVRAPGLAAPAGWKAYPPKENVALDEPGGVGGTKTVEVLLLPEGPGAVMLPALELPTFDPVAKRYVTLKTDPIRLEATGAAAATGAATSAPGSGGAAGPAVENVIGAAIRPIRARTRLGRDVGTTFLRSRAFVWLLFLPPLAFGLIVLVDRVRERLSIDTHRTRRRRMRTMVRKHLGAAVAHRDAGRATAFYIEIDRVLREVLAARLGRGVTGLRRDELEATLGERGMPADLTARLLAELESCDQARFAPGGETEGTAAMSAALERADELIGLVEKTRLSEEARA
ncbi:MAG TPA: BatD family protein [Polyangia bacterium]|nr:BatD family protein [Polyangia bacterium]